MADRSPPPDPDAPPSEAERDEAGRLRDALENPASTHGDVALARALSSAWSAADLGPEEHRAIVARALARKPAPRRRPRVLALASLGAGALTALTALAAAVALLVGHLPGPARPTGTAAAALVPSRSTQALFPQPFAREGGVTARIDRIALARGGDLRENEFARWGVR